MEDLHESPGFWPYSGTALAVLAVLESKPENQRGPSLCFSLCSSSKEINLKKKKKRERMFFKGKKKSYAEAELLQYERLLYYTSVRKIHESMLVFLPHFSTCKN